MYSQIEEEALSKLYEILESTKDSTLEELKKAYRNLARKYHPDLNYDDEESTKKMSDINAAYDILTHQNKLRDYLNNYVQTYTANQHNNLEGDKEKSSGYTSVETNDEQSWQDASYTIIPPSYETFEEFIEYLKENFYEAYQNVRYDEKTYTIKNRYEDIYQLFSKYNYCEKIQSKLLREGIKLITFSGMELIWQLKKLKKHVDDTIPKYTVRNRKTLAGILVLATLINPVSAKTNDDNQPVISQSTQVTETNTEKIDILLDDSYKLVRIYIVKPGETLSDISINLNTTIDNIKEKNNLKSSELYADQVLEIPYYINKDELKYYTTSVNTEGYEKLEDLAEKYQTDIRTIYSINTEAFAEVDGTYMQISNELLVPTFPTQKEVQEQKSKDTYQKTSN